MTTTAPTGLTRTQPDLLARIHQHWQAEDLRFKPVLHAVDRATAEAVPVHPDQLADYPETAPTRQQVLDDALAAWDVALNAVRNVAGTLLEASEWLWLLGHDDAHTSVLTDEQTATRAYHEMTGEIAAAVAATHATDHVQPLVVQAVGLASEPVTPDDVYGHLVDQEQVEADPKARVLVRLALVVLADTATIREPAPGKYLPASA